MAGFFYGENIPQARADSDLVTKEGIVFTGGPGTSNYARVIKVDSTYHMWYEDTTFLNLFHATSADGENWENEELCNIGNVHEPSVIWDESDSKYKMWFEVAGTGLLWYAESTDGISWNGPGGPLDPPEGLTFTDGDHNWENDGRYMPFVIKDGSTYKLWYQSFSDVPGEAGDRRINYATSSDGINWDNSYHVGNVEFQGSSDNNIVFGVGDPGDWDVGALYSFMIGKFSDGTFGMMYAAHDGDNIYKLGVAYSDNPDPDDNGIKWDRGENGEHAISEDVSIYFPSFTEESNGYKFWYVDGTGNVYYATSFFDEDIMEGEDIDDNDEENTKAHVDSWKAYQYEDQTSKLCKDKLKLEIKGKHFEDDAEVKIGGHNASSMDRKSSKKIVAKFCMNKLLDNQTSRKRTVSVTNPHTNTEKADKKINLDDIGHNMSAEDFNLQTVEGVKSIQTALVSLNFLDKQYITGFYGPITTEAVRKFQGQNGLPQTGYVGPLTKAKLEEKMK